jgi:hypothetical protein
MLVETFSYDIQLFVLSVLTIYFSYVNITNLSGLYLLLINVVKYLVSDNEGGT